MVSATTVEVTIAVVGLETAVTEAMVYPVGTLCVKFVERFMSAKEKRVMKRYGSLLGYSK